MPNSVDGNENFLDGINEIASRVEKWPEWKRQGWAILDLSESTSNFGCDTTVSMDIMSESSLNSRHGDEKLHL